MQRSMPKEAAIGWKNTNYLTELVVNLMSPFCQVVLDSTGYYPGLIFFKILHPVCVYANALWSRVGFS